MLYIQRLNKIHDLISSATCRERPMSRFSQKGRWKSTCLQCGCARCHNNRSHNNKKGPSSRSITHFWVLQQTVLGQNFVQAQAWEHVLVLVKRQFVHDFIIFYDALCSIIGCTRTIKDSARLRVFHTVPHSHRYDKKRSRSRSAVIRSLG